MASTTTIRGRKVDQSAPARTSASMPSTSTLRKSTDVLTCSATMSASVVTETSIGVNS